MATSDETTEKRAANSARSARSEEELAEQISRLQQDIKAIAASVTKLADDKLEEARGVARHQASKLVRSGQHTAEEIQDEFGQMEKQIKDTIREKPLTSVVGAIALGFLLAVVTR